MRFVFKIALLAGLAFGAATAQAAVIDCKIERDRGEQGYLPDRVVIDTDPKGGLYGQVSVQLFGGVVGDFGPTYVDPSFRKGNQMILQFSRAPSEIEKLPEKLYTSFKKSLGYSLRYRAEQKHLEVNVRGWREIVATGETPRVCTIR